MGATASIHIFELCKSILKIQHAKQKLRIKEFNKTTSYLSSILPKYSSFKPIGTCWNQNIPKTEVSTQLECYFIEVKQPTVFVA